MQEFISGIFEEDVHAKRVASLVNGVDGVLHAASLGGHAIGQGLAEAQGLAPKHAIKQVDRLLSNPALSMETIFACWVHFVVGQCAEIIVVTEGNLRSHFDWTEARGLGSVDRGAGHADGPLKKHASRLEDGDALGARQSTK